MGLPRFTGRASELLINRQAPGLWGRLRTVCSWSGNRRRRRLKASPRAPGRRNSGSCARRLCVAGVRPFLLTLRASLVRAFAAHDGAEGSENDLDVERERPVLNVVEVQPHHLFKGEVAAAADLPVTCHPG